MAGGNRFLVSLVSRDGWPMGVDYGEATRAEADERAFGIINEFARTVPLESGRGFRVRVLEVGDDNEIRLVNLVRRPDDDAPLPNPLYEETKGWR